MDRSWRVEANLTVEPTGRRGRDEPDLHRVDYVWKTTKFWSSRSLAIRVTMVC